MNQITETKTQHYFVDESGDGVVFDKKGKVIIGSEGCQSSFILGLITVEDQAQLKSAFAELRDYVVNDTYLNRLQSIKKRVNAGNFFFHAKDDAAEVRMEVFKILVKQNVHFSAVVKDMPSVLEYIRARQAREPSYRYHPDELYDLTVRLLFRDRLHQSDNYLIHFAKRRSDRTNTLRDALETTRNRFASKWNINAASNIEIKVQPAWMDVGFQAVDYFLWALQRFYERSEDRFIDYVWDKIGLVWDLDDKRTAGYGVYYTRKNPLTLPKIANRRI